MRQVKTANDSVIFKKPGKVKNSERPILIASNKATKIAIFKDKVHLFIANICNKFDSFNPTFASLNK